MFARLTSITACAAAKDDDDETSVRELCAHLEIEYSMRRVVVEKRGDSFSENDARRARYSALIGTRARAKMFRHCDWSHSRRQPRNDSAALGARRFS